MRENFFRNFVRNPKLRRSSANDRLKSNMTKLKTFFLAATLATALMRPIVAQNTLPGAGTKFTKIAAGDNHNLALKADGTVVAWGAGQPEETGYGNYGQSTVPDGLTGVIAVAAGFFRSMALKSDGTIMTWGHNGEGSAAPGGLQDVVAIAAGTGHYLALKSDGTVAAWGGGQDSPTASVVPAGLNGVVAIAAGHYHSLALKSDGTVVAWGAGSGAYYPFGQSTVPSGLTGVIAVAAGTWHSLALKSDGTVVGWGYNVSGESTVPDGLNGVVAIAAGGFHSLALKSDGTIVVWGRNTDGERTVPNGLTGVAAMAAGGAHILALKSDGTIVGWGDNSFGQLPQPLITTQSGNKGSAIGEGVSFSVTVSGIPPSYQWLKDGTNISGATSSVYNISNVQSNDAGSYSVIITNVSGSVTSSNAVLTVVPILITQQPQNQTPVAGWTVNFSVTVSGSAPLGYQWRKEGTNISGATFSVYTISNVQSSAAGNYSVIITNAFGSVTSSNALLTLRPLLPHAPGTVVSWGEQVIPYVAPGTRFTKIAAGSYHNLALKSDGTVVAWAALAP